MADTSLARKHRQYKLRLKCDLKWLKCDLKWPDLEEHTHACKKLLDHAGDHRCDCGVFKRVKRTIKRFE